MDARIFSRFKSDFSRCSIHLVREFMAGFSDVHDVLSCWSVVFITELAFLSHMFHCRHWNASSERKSMNDFIGCIQIWKFGIERFNFPRLYFWQWRIVRCLALDNGQWALPWSRTASCAATAPPSHCVGMHKLCVPPFLKWMQMWSCHSLFYPFYLRVYYA